MERYSNWVARKYRLENCSNSATYACNSFVLNKCYMINFYSNSKAKRGIFTNLLCLKN